MLSNGNKGSDSFEEMLDEVKGRCLDYSVRVNNEKRIVKSLSLKYSQLHMKADYLAKVCEESQKALKLRLGDIRSLIPDKLAEIPECQLTELYNFFGLSPENADLSEFLLSIEQFDPEFIPEQVIKYKVAESQIVQGRSLSTVEEFLNLCVDCRMKLDLLNVYKSEMRRVLTNIDRKKELILNLEGKIQEFLQDYIEKEEHDRLDTKEEPVGVVLDSDELYGEIWLAGDSSTIIFEQPSRCSTCCILL